MDPALAVPKPILNYPDTAFAIHGLHPVLSPRISPDGTRLALRSRQIWAARRNMNLPPQITQVGSQGVVDSTARVFINAAQGLPSTITVTSTDPEGDAIFCTAFFLQDAMTFNPATCTLNWTPSAPVGTTFYVKFQVTTASGGTDAIIAVLTVVPSLRPSLAREAPGTELRDGPNPTRGRFAITPPIVRGAASLTVFDLSGRRVAVIRRPSGTPLVWEGTDGAGAAVAPGIYLYRVEAGRYRQEGKVVIVR